LRKGKRKEPRTETMEFDTERERGKEGEGRKIEEERRKKEKKFSQFSQFS